MPAQRQTRPAHSKTWSPSSGVWKVTCSRGCLSACAGTPTLSGQIRSRARLECLRSHRPGGPRAGRHLATQRPTERTGAGTGAQQGLRARLHPGGQVVGRHGRLHSSPTQLLRALSTRTPSICAGLCTASSMAQMIAGRAASGAVRAAAVQPGSVPCRADSGSSAACSGRPAQHHSLPGRGPGERAGASPAALRPQGRAGPSGNVCAGSAQAGRRRDWAQPVQQPGVGRPAPGCPPPAAPACKLRLRLGCRRSARSQHAAARAQRGAGTLHRPAQDCGLHKGCAAARPGPCRLASRPLTHQARRHQAISPVRVQQHRDAGPPPPLLGPSLACAGASPEPQPAADIQHAGRALRDRQRAGG